MGSVEGLTFELDDTKKPREASGPVRHRLALYRALPSLASHRIVALPTLTGQAVYVILSRPKGGEESLPCRVGTLRRFAAQGDKLPIIPLNPVEPELYFMAWAKSSLEPV